MTSRYPFVLVHGIAIKDYKYFRAFGRIEKILKDCGYSVFTADTDGFGTVENNAEQLKKFILNVLHTQSAEKINIIAHSKGGLDSKYMIQRLGMEDSVASLTTLCTPHRGSEIASKLLKLPKPVKKFTAFWINFWYRLFGDSRPDSLTVCEQLKSVDAQTETLNFSDKVYCQSFSATLEKSRDDFIMGVPLLFSKRFEKDLSDGLVSKNSAEFANYRGDCLDESVSHIQIAGFALNKKKKQKIYDFYRQLCAELTQKGY